MIYAHYLIEPRLGQIEYEQATCIDLGCGDYRSDVAKQVLEMPFKSLTSIEGYEFDFNHMPTSLAKNHIKKCADVVSVLKSKETYDVGFAFDVLEHLEKQKGELVLDWMIAHCDRIVIFIPVEPEGFHRTWDDGNPLQEHVSYWSAEDFEKRGLKVEVCEKIHSENIGGQTLRFDALWVTKYQS